jgi:hypothetical protein
MIGTATNWTGDVPDIYPYPRRITGAAVLAHAVMRRLVTKRGALPWAPGVGYDVRELQNESFSTATRGPLDAFASYIRAEALADERVETAKVDVTFNASTSALRIEMTATTAEGPFRLVVSIADLTLSLLALEV